MINWGLDHPTVHIRDCGFRWLSKLRKKKKQTFAIAEGAERSLENRDSKNSEFY